MRSELFTIDGKRKYLTASEREDFIAAARSDERATVRSLCNVLAFTGCRISEALELSAQSIDFAAKTVIFRTLKQGTGKDGEPKMVYRAVPVPDALLDMLDDIHAVRKAQKLKKARTAPLWSWGRTQAYKHIKGTMTTAGITGAHASPKGLRHGFGILAMTQTRNPRLVQRWMGHSKIENTMIYMDAIGDEERELASRMW